MSNPTLLNVNEEKTGDARGSAVAFVARDSVIAELSATPCLPQLGPLVCYSAKLDDPVADGWLADVSALIIEVSSANSASIERMRKVLKARPQLPVIAAIPAADIAMAGTLLRYGVSDIIGLPIDCAQVEGLLAELSSGRPSLEAGHPLAPLVVVAGSTGGCGATTVLTHLAAALASDRNLQGKLCVIDLDLQAGEVAYYLGQEPHVTISMLLDAGDRLDPSLIQGAVTDSGRGFAIIAAPEIITPLESVDQDRLLELISHIRRSFGMVLVDLPSVWSNWSLSLAVAADQLVLVTQLTIPALRQSRRQLELLDSVGVKRDRIRVVVNRVVKGLFKSIDIKQANDVLGCEITVTIADQAGDLVNAQNEGQLLTDLQKRGRFAEDINRLEKLLVSGRQVS